MRKGLAVVRDDNAIARELRVQFVVGTFLTVFARSKRMFRKSMHILPMRRAAIFVIYGARADFAAVAPLYPGGANILVKAKITSKVIA